MLPKVAKEQDLNPDKMIHLDHSSQKKPSYVSSKNWILIQYSERNKRSFLAKVKEYLTEKVTPVLNLIKTLKGNVTLICCGNTGQKNQILFR